MSNVDNLLALCAQRYLEASFWPPTPAEPVVQGNLYVIGINDCDSGETIVEQAAGKDAESASAEAIRALG